MGSKRGLQLRKAESCGEDKATTTAAVARSSVSREGQPRRSSTKTTALGWMLIRVNMSIHPLFPTGRVLRWRYTFFWLNGFLNGGAP